MKIEDATVPESEPLYRRDMALVREILERLEAGETRLPVVQDERFAERLRHHFLILTDAGYIQGIADEETVIQRLGMGVFDSYRLTSGGHSYLAKLRREEQPVEPIKNGDIPLSPFDNGYRGPAAP